MSEDFGYQHGFTCLDEASRPIVMEQWFLAADDTAAKKRKLKKFPERLPLAEGGSKQNAFLLTLGILGDQPMPYKIAPYAFYGKVRNDLLGNDLTHVKYAFGSSTYYAGMPPEPSSGGIPVDTKGVAELYVLQGKKGCEWSVFALTPTVLKVGDPLRTRGFEKVRRVLQTFGGDQCSEQALELPNGSKVEPQYDPDKTGYGKWRNTLKSWCKKNCITSDGWLAIDSDGTPHDPWGSAAEMWEYIPKPQ